MRKIIQPRLSENVIAQISGIPYKTVPYWYGAAARALYLDLLLPKQAEFRKELPVIVWACGGAFSQMDRNVWLPAMIDFAKAGYAVASIDYRTAPVYPFPAAVEDIRAAVRFLRANSAQYGLDPNRIVSMGESAGGYLACMAALAGSEYDVGEHLDQPSVVQAVVDFYGKIDFSKAGKDEGCNGLVNSLFLNGRRDAAFLNAIACKNLVNANTCPMLIFHGAEDPLVPLVESEELYQSLCDCGVRSDLYVLEGAGHGEDVFYQPEIRRIILNFLNEVLS